MAGAAAKRYARAIFELAQEEGQVEAWAERLAEVRDLFSLPEMQQLLHNPTLSVERRQEAVTAALGDQAGPETLNLARLLVESGRVDRAGEIAEEYSSLVDEAAGRVRVAATAAVELTEAEKQELARGLSARLGKEVM